MTKSTELLQDFINCPSEHHVEPGANAQLQQLRKGSTHSAKGTYSEDQRFVPALHRLEHQAWVQSGVGRV